ncbi:MAG: DUF1828 domain-containing protein [Endomicrobiaceae bacterium]|nr:DUF1828 domain-containing protein [Endomicrobiaceae bacterium]
MSDINKLIDTYYKWLKDKTSWQSNDKFTEITTPYLDRHNDYIRVYLIQDGNDFLLTDEGETIDDLVMSGCILDTPKRKKILEYTLNGFGVSRQDNKLIVKTSIDSFALKKHNLLQAILSVNDMFYLSEANIKNLFFEDVKNFLDISDVRYTENVIFKGISGFDRKFDFVIPKSKNASERVLKTITYPNKNAADLFIMDWLDTKDIRPDKSRAIVLANDFERDNININFSEALKNYGISTCFWSDREKIKEQLTA